ncbi:MAG TPA: DUF4381 domain-containing protein [Woeseiaceae bacterium]|nr:DUF4381 domain-containing protein [Woeseiaceae bacterium]
MDPEQIPLRDLHLPEAIGWWPLAPGWWVLLGLAGLVLLLLFRKAWVRWREDAARRVALRELARVESTYHESPNPVLLATRLSELLRRTMLAYSPRKEVAGLTGLQWLAWLDRGLDEKPFTEGPGRMLKELPYRRADSPARAVDVDALLKVVRLRLKTRLPEAS